MACVSWLAEITHCHDAAVTPPTDGPAAVPNPYSAKTLGAERLTDRSRRFTPFR